MVGGYVRKHVTLRIFKGLRAIALAVGISQRVYSDTQVIFITIIAIYIMLAEKIGTPLIILVSDSSVSSVSIQKSIPVDSFLFFVLSRKSHTKNRVLSTCHSLDCIAVLVLVAGRCFLRVNNLFYSESLGFRCCRSRVSCRQSSSISFASRIWARV
jgi:hypothetical protein